MRRQVEVSKPKPKPFYERKTKTMKLEAVAAPPVGRHRRFANGSNSIGIAHVALIATHTKQRGGEDSSGWHGAPTSRRRAQARRPYRRLTHQLISATQMWPGWCLTCRQYIESRIPQKGTPRTDRLPVGCSSYRRRL